jgi:hypothetical protein
LFGTGDLFSIVFNLFFQPRYGLGILGHGQ